MRLRTCSALADDAVRATAPHEARNNFADSVVGSLLRFAQPCGITVPWLPNHPVR